MTCPGGAKSSPYPVLLQKDHTPSSFGAHCSTKHANTSINNLPGQHTALTYLLFVAIHPGVATLPPCRICPGVSTPLGISDTARFWPQSCKDRELQVCRQRQSWLCPGKALRSQVFPLLLLQLLGSALHNKFNNSLKAPDPEAMQLRGNREQVLALQELGPGVCEALGFSGLSIQTIRAATAAPRAVPTLMLLMIHPARSFCSWSQLMSGQVPARSPSPCCSVPRSW